MEPLQTRPFDFDGWMMLARNDPSAFEDKRREAIDEMVRRAPPDRQQRLRGLQWRIELERRRYRNPQMACAHLFSMMWDQVYGENGLLDSLRLAKSAQPWPARRVDTADVIAFRTTPRHGR